jgi:GT2 family glycosyltransferase
VGVSLSVLVVSHGLEALLARCLDAAAAALRAAGGPARLVVVDNASDPPYVAEALCPDGVTMDVVRLDGAASFSRANNVAAAHHPADAYLLLNNDVLLHPRAIAEMQALLGRERRAGVVGARLVFPDATIQHCGVVFGAGDAGPYHVNRRRPGRAVPRADRELQAVTGACMLVARQAWDALGGLDESYPFGLEDVDFCLRARQRGYRVLVSSRVDSLHFESMTPGRVEKDVESRRIFMQRWRGRYGLDG